MKSFSLPLALVVLAVVIIATLIFRIKSTGNEPFTMNTSNVASEDCIPTFADGGGPYYQENSPFREKIVPENNEGIKLLVSGKVLLNDCKTPVSNAVIDIWQANESGDYQDEWYRGKINTDNKGSYSFETVVPKGYGEGTGYRPPHIHFKIFVDDQEIITSQMFFPEVKGTPGFEDAYIMKVEETERSGDRILEANHNIILP